ncbi:MAG: ATP-dependent DNA helicase [Bacilli bacterium]|nr:ATP-dependent DNA helicase [Bacilli bacterium]MBO6285268.1 ATP-dependent DNA helicase [Bacilli bacterium]
MSQKRYLSLSVHQLVDFLLRQGDIDDRVYNQETMNAGSRLHSAYQSKQDASYISEMFLSARIEVEEGVITLSGRADGVFFNGSYPVIDEIKTTIAPVKEFAAEQEAWHLGQAACYAYMYLCMQGGKKAGIRLTYFHQINTDDTLLKDYEFTFEQLKEMVEGYCRDYLSFLSLTFAHMERRDASVKELKFPYKEFRKGQRELAKYVYGLASRGGELFVEAPTGTGKTMSTLFPSVKAYKEGRLDKIFYLTAKNTGAQAAFAAASDLIAAGLELFDVTLLAKEKICFCPGRQCNPDECPFAKGYFGKIRQAIVDALSSGKRFDSAFIQDHCLSHELCPFEFQLDLSNHCDLIIADYNYFFDPIVHLERYFDEAVDSSTYLALIDEAHNVLDRGRDMYSCSLSKSMAEEARKSLKGDRYKGLRSGLKKISKVFDGLIGEGEYSRDLEKPPEDLLKTIANLKATFQRATKKGPLVTSEAYREFSREANRLSRILTEHYDSTYQCYVRQSRGEIEFRALCVDPSAKLFQSIKKIKGAVLFSATLSPIDYYMDATLGGFDHPYLLLSSPFPKENFDLMVAPKVSVRYKDRASSYPEVAKYLQAFVQGKMGNYFVFFPSYEYMEQMLPLLDFGDGVEVLAQQRQMTPRQREEFLELFSPNPDHSKVGLLILGGAFSEGIDLVDDRLIGVAVVGVGLPQIGKENDLIRDYYDRKLGEGFAYAYKDPGMNKVLQAVGRLIRSEHDRGAALLIDDRYLQDEYRDLFQRIYQDYDVVLSPSEVSENLREFYKKKR